MLAPCLHSKIACSQDVPKGLLPTLALLLLCLLGTSIYYSNIPLIYTLILVYCFSAILVCCYVNILTWGAKTKLSYARKNNIFIYRHRTDRTEGNMIAQ